MTEALPTLVTCVGSLSHMKSLMGEQVQGLAEVFPAVGAFTGALPCASSLVFDKVRVAAKDFPTL